MILQEKTKEHNSSWLLIPDHSYRTLIIGRSGSRKTNALLDTISHQLDINKICLHAKTPYEAQYQLLINKRESLSSKHSNDPKAFIEDSNDMVDMKILMNTSPIKNTKY